MHKLQLLIIVASNQRYAVIRLWIHATSLRNIS